METANSNTIEAKPRLATILGVAFTVLVLGVLAAAIFYVPPMFKTTARPIELDEMKSIELVIKGYQTEYSKLPPLGVTDESQYLESKGLLIDTLTAKNDAQNPRRIPFYEPPPRSTRTSAGESTVPSSETEVRDRNGNFYRLHLDWNGDGEIANPKAAGSKINASVIVYSAGPDGDYDTWADNFTSWE